MNAMECQCKGSEVSVACVFVYSEEPIELVEGKRRAMGMRSDVVECYRSLQDVGLTLAFCLGKRGVYWKILSRGGMRCLPRSFWFLC